MSEVDKYLKDNNYWPDKFDWKDKQINDWGIKMPIRMIFNDFANMCGYFQNPEGLEHINNGYTCIHPENHEREVIDDYVITGSIGKCYCWSCPLGVQDPDDEEMVIIDDEDLIEIIKKTDYWLMEVEGE